MKRKKIAVDIFKETADKGNPFARKEYGRDFLQNEHVFKKIIFDLHNILIYNQLLLMLIMGSGSFNAAAYQTYFDLYPAMSGCIRNEKHSKVIITLLSL